MAARAADGGTGGTPSLNACPFSQPLFFLGMPLEVWKTHLGRFRDQGTFEGFMNIYRNNGGGLKGIAGFWRGTSAKMVESASKGCVGSSRGCIDTQARAKVTHILLFPFPFLSFPLVPLSLAVPPPPPHPRPCASHSSVLMFSKEFIKDSCLGVGMSPTTAGFVSGAGGGVCQVSVMGPCTFLVTSMVTGGKQTSLMSQIRSTWQAKVRAAASPSPRVPPAPPVARRPTHPPAVWCRASAAFTPAARPLPFARPPTGPAGRALPTLSARVRLGGGHGMGLRCAAVGLLSRDALTHAPFFPAHILCPVPYSSSPLPVCVHSHQALHQRQSGNGQADRGTGGPCWRDWRNHGLLEPPL